jgi:GR25 family glycosyltransferase involved in LPS biosynthesis
MKGTRIDEYFDKVYLLNLEKRPERMALADKRMQFCDIHYKRFGATDGSVMKRLWESYYKENTFFSNSSYLGCAVSHLSIYRDALERGYSRILIVEDDNRIRYNANQLFSSKIQDIPEDWHLLYLGFIPLNDDCSRWDYNLFQLLKNGVGEAKNFWGLFAYGISSDTMKETLEIYERDFPMELDRFFVAEIQPRKKSYGIVPQIFAADDGVSDNSGRNEQGMLQRSVDSRFAKLTDYI